MNANRSNFTSGFKLLDSTVTTNEQNNDVAQKTENG